MGYKRKGTSSLCWCADDRTLYLSYVFLNIISKMFINLKCKFMFCPLFMVLIEFYALCTFHICIV